jgi:hypothetical protein
MHAAARGAKHRGALGAERARTRARVQRGARRVRRHGHVSTPAPEPPHPATGASLAWLLVPAQGPPHSQGERGPLGRPACICDMTESIDPPLQASLSPPMRWRRMDPCPRCCCPAVPLRVLQAALVERGAAAGAPALPWGRSWRGRRGRGRRGARRCTGQSGSVATQAMAWGQEIHRKWAELGRAAAQRYIQWLLAGAAQAGACACREGSSGAYAWGSARGGRLGPAGWWGGRGLAHGLRSPQARDSCACAGPPRQFGGRGSKWVRAPREGVPMRNPAEAWARAPFSLPRVGEGGTSAAARARRARRLRHGASGHWGGGQRRRATPRRAAPDPPPGRLSAEAFGAPCEAGGAIAGGAQTPARRPRAAGAAARRGRQIAVARQRGALPSPWTCCHAWTHTTMPSASLLK